MLGDDSVDVDRQAIARVIALADGAARLSRVGHKLWLGRRRHAVVLAACERDLPVGLSAIERHLGDSGARI